MAKYAAVCHRFPELQIGADIKFQQGMFETDDPELWRQVEANDWFNVHIFPRDLAPSEPEPDAAPSAPDEEPDPATPRVRHGGRGSRS